MAIAGRLKGLVQGERHVTGNRELVESSIDQSLCQTMNIYQLLSAALTPGEGLTTHLLCLSGCHARLHLAQALADEQDTIDQHAVGGPLDLEVAEECIGTEKREDLIDTVVRLAIGVNIDVGRRGRKRGESVCGAACAGAEGEEREIACERSGISICGRLFLSLRTYIAREEMSWEEEGRAKSCVVPITATPWSSRKMEWYA